MKTLETHDELVIRLENDSVAFKRLLAHAIFLVPCLGVWYFVGIEPAALIFGFCVIGNYLSITPKY